MQLRNAVFFGIALAAVGLAPAAAGVKQTSTVTLLASGAEGVMGSTRNSADTIQLLECEVHGYATSRWGYCFARSTSWTVTRSCYAYDNIILDNIQSISTDDFVAFAFDATGRCTRVSVVKSSRWEPKVW
jgi:hypothetical protein